jgi:phosphohistidine phosphatase
MKTIFIVRHAKSSWAEPFQQDFERSLNERGMRDAPEMAARFKSRGFNPELILTSTAKRAMDTCLIFANKLEYPKSAIRLKGELYHAPLQVLWQVIHSIENEYDTVMLFGHNPGLTDLANDMTVTFRIDNLPTCSVLGMQAECDAWNDFKLSEKSLLYVDYPKLK